MPRALFTSKNLIGDALYVQPALEAWAKEHPEWAIDLLTLDDHVTCLYEGMTPAFQLREVLPKYRIVFDRCQKKYDFEHEFNVNSAFLIGHEKKMHVSEAYANLLGVELPKNVRVKYTPPEMPHDEGLVLISMHSNSCASREGKPPNKMLSWAHWFPILEMCRQLGPIGVLGGPNDRAPLPISEDEFYTGLPLPLIANMMKDAKLLITIDNGMGHLAGTQGTPTILFYPSCLGQHWIYPLNERGKLYIHQMDPSTFPLDAAQLIVREGIKKLLG